MLINLISDTVTKPTPEMLQAMLQAEVGDDVFGEDPTVNSLEAKAAGLFGKEAALFCPSGTMTNQIALKVHTQPLDEVICDEFSHIYQYEVGGYAYNSGIGINLIKGTNGKITSEQVANAIKPVYDWLPISKLVVLENTANKGGGSYYTLEEILPISKLCRDRGLNIHLDGARIFNALVETGESTLEVGKAFDSISICLSKGLGAPIGSLLIGNQTFIKQARRVRKVMGGGMRQAGYLAAAGIYALDHHVQRLKDDNDRAKLIGKTLESLDYVENVRPVQTNIVIFDVKSPYTASSFLEKLKTEDVNATAFGPQTIRFVTHLDFTEAMLEKTLQILKEM
ncbi:MAG: aminotransferase class I/II-fold pyridoxal phosphate-dependent enzyme [Saprospiraceae bacterium]|nr:aminotransferase class I/II-fold pyridoxal phosphate-dependent enzyme [Saprospiraceae bacterium]